jgi:hypothetical protein
MLRKLITWAVVAIVLIAIWRINNGDVNTLVDNIWNILSQGADVAIKLWNSILGISHHINDSTAVTTPVVAATPSA